MQYDIAIVGGGVMGSACAWRLSLAGLRVVLLEQSPSHLHASGSSHGHSRIIRRTYLEPHYAKLMNVAYPLWDALSQSSGCGPLRAYRTGDVEEPPLVRFTGGLSLVLVGSKEHADLLRACASAGVAVKEVLPSEALARWGLVLPEGTVAVEEEAGSTGVAVGVGRCVAAMQAAAVARGAELRAGATVVGLQAAANRGVRLQVQCSGGEVEEVRSRRAVLCPGAWGGPLLEALLGLRLPLQPLLCSTAYYGRQAAADATPAAGAAQEPLEPLPVLIDWRPKEQGGGIYGCPVTEWGAEGEAYAQAAAYKFAIHGGVPTTAAGRPYAPSEATTVEPVKAWVARHAPTFAPQPLPGSTTTCLYTMTPDEGFVLDEVPVPGEGAAAAGGLAFLCAGFSGHGFKFAPLVGEVCAQWCLASLASAAVAPGAPSPMHSVEQWLQEATARHGSAAPGEGGAGEAFLPFFSARRF